MNILICDDEKTFADELKKSVAAYFDEKRTDVQIDAFDDPVAATAGGKAYQIAFLDIQMGMPDGMAVAKLLKKRNSRTVIFFITAYENYQDEAMDLRAFRFFCKPVSPDRLRSGLDRALEYIDETYVDFYIFSNNECRKLLIDDIIYIERSNRLVTLNSAHGNFTVKESFDEWENRLANSFFYKIHKSYIINLHYVTGYNYTSVCLQDNLVLPIASHRQADFHQFWFDYLSRR